MVEVDLLGHSQDRWSNLNINTGAAVRSTPSKNNTDPRHFHRDSAITNNKKENPAGIYRHIVLQSEDSKIGSAENALSPWPRRAAAKNHRGKLPRRVAETSCREIKRRAFTELKRRGHSDPANRYEHNRRQQTREGTAIDNSATCKQGESLRRTQQPDRKGEWTGKEAEVTCRADSDHHRTRLHVRKKESRTIRDLHQARHTDSNKERIKKEELVTCGVDNDHHQKRLQDRKKESRLRNDPHQTQCLQHKNGTKRAGGVKIYKAGAKLYRNYTTLHRNHSTRGEPTSSSGAQGADRDKVNGSSKLHNPPAKRSHRGEPASGDTQLHTQRVRGGVEDPVGGDSKLHQKPAEGAEENTECRIREKVSGSKKESNPAAKGAKEDTEATASREKEKSERPGREGGRTGG